MVFRHRDCLRHYHLRFDLRWTLQSRYFHMFRDLARVSLEEGPLFHIHTDLRGLHCWSVSYGHVLGANRGL